MYPQINANLRQVLSFLPLLCLPFFATSAPTAMSQPVATLTPAPAPAPEPTTIDQAAVVAAKPKLSKAAPINPTPANPTPANPTPATSMSVTATPVTATPMPVAKRAAISVLAGVLTLVVALWIGARRD